MLKKTGSPCVPFWSQLTYAFGFLPFMLFIRSFDAHNQLLEFDSGSFNDHAHAAKIPIVMPRQKKNVRASVGNYVPIKQR